MAAKKKEERRDLFLINSDNCEVLCGPCRLQECLDAAESELGYGGEVGDFDIVSRTHTLDVVSVELKAKEIVNAK
jgi:hypothetical protein